MASFTILSKVAPLLGELTGRSTSQSSSPSPHTDASLDHLVSSTTTHQSLWWAVSASLGAAGILFTELNSWTALSSRTVSGCSPAANGTSSSSATLSACSGLGLFECQETLTVVTSPSATWSTTLLLFLLLVVGIWGTVILRISRQTTRAANLLPHRIYVVVQDANWALLVLVVLVTGGYCALKAKVFSSMSNEVLLPACGPPGGLLLSLAPVFSPPAPSASFFLSFNPQLWALVNSTLFLLLSFSGLYQTASRYASDPFADIGLAQIVLQCPTQKSAALARSGGGRPRRTPCALHACDVKLVGEGLVATPSDDDDGGAPSPRTPLTGGSAGAAAADPPARLVGFSSVTRAISSAPFLAVRSRALDDALRAWCTTTERGRRSAKGIGGWGRVRYLVGLDRETVADAASFVREFEWKGHGVLRPVSGV
jgi:hypothetical protein